MAIMPYLYILLVDSPYPSVITSNFAFFCVIYSFTSILNEIE